MKDIWLLVLVFMLILTPIIFAQEPIELYQLCPMVVESQPKLLKIDYDYLPGLLIIKLINPAVPENPSFNSNHYVYIPGEIELKSGDKISNIDIVLSPGLEIIGDVKIYPTWMGDMFEKRAERLIKFGKTIKTIMSAPSISAMAFVMLDEGPSDPFNAVRIYRTTVHNIRGLAMKFFMEIIYNYNDPENPKPGLPVDKTKPHWILPPSSAIVIKVPVREISGEPKFFALAVWKYYHLDTERKFPDEEEKFLRFKASNVNRHEPALFSYKKDCIRDFASPELNIQGDFWDIITENTERVIKYIIGAIESFTIWLGWAGSDLDLKIIDPEGNIYYGNQLANNSEYIVINNPIPGEWKFIVIGKDVSPDGEQFNLKVFESEKRAEIPEFNIRTDFNMYSNKKFGKWKYIFGYIETEIEPTSDTVISDLSLNFKLPNDHRLIRNRPKIQFIKNGKVYALAHGNYKTVKNKKDELEIKIDFSKGIVFDRRKYWRNLWKDVKEKCLVKRLYKNFRKCYNDVKEKFIDESSMFFVLKMGEKLKIRFPVLIFGRENEYFVETIGMSTAPNGEHFKKGNILNLIS